MVEIRLYNSIIDNSKLIFVDVVAKYRGRWVLCMEKNRDTWECPGGHIDKGETPEQAAKRELWEETGAIEFDIEPIGYYGAKGSDGVMESVEEVFGQIFYAEIKSIGKLPDYEMERIEFFENSHKIGLIHMRIPYLLIWQKNIPLKNKDSQILQCRVNMFRLRPLS